MSDITTLELTIEQAKAAVKLRDHADKLLKNRDFKALFDDEYFDSYVKNTALMLSEVKVDDPKMHEDLVLELEAVGRVRGFIRSVFQKGAMADKSIVEAEEMIDELRAAGEDE